MGTLYIVATPIGNLDDITLRALHVLKEVDFILCEDTRVTKKLLRHFEVEKPTISYHQHSKLQKVEEILRLLGEGKKLAVVSDAGTPGISDPGNQLVQEVSKQLPDVSIIPIPGVSAITALSSISGLSMDRFMFLGFPPQKKKRKKFFEEAVNSPYPVVLYESPYRIQKTLQDIKDIDSSLYLIVGRELSKKFETIYRGTVEEVIKKIKPQEIKGEFVLVVGKSNA